MIPGEAIQGYFGDPSTVPPEAPRSGLEWDEWDTVLLIGDVSLFRDSSKRFKGICDLLSVGQISHGVSHGTAPNAKQCQ